MCPRLLQGFLFVGVSLFEAFGLGLPSGPAVATTATTTFSVTATVVATCLISATNLDFGSYTGMQANATSTITVTCTNTTPYNVGLDAGISSGATTTARKMTGTGGATMSYALYQDGARTINWGTNVGVDTEAGAGSGSAQSLTVYGQIAGGQYVAPGAYNDTITAIITY